MKIFLFIIFAFKFLESNLNNRNYFLKLNKDLRALQLIHVQISNKTSKESTSGNIFFNNKNNENIENNQNFKRKNLIIGVIMYYDWEKISTFFKSYIRAGFENCDIVMFISGVSSVTLNKMKSYGILVYNIPDKFKNILISNYRWKLYEDYLNENKNKYKQVFTGDIGDTFFQLDLFKFYEKKKSFLGIALENGTLYNNYTKKWLISLYGEDKYRSIEHERNVCIGSVWGTIDKMIDFSRMMWENISSKKDLSENTFDQESANYIIYINKAFEYCLIKSDNKNGLVMTFGLVNITDIHFDSENNILNGNGEIVAVIHQYNKKKEIIKIFNELLTKPLKIPYKYKLFKFLTNYILYISLLIIFSIFGVILLCKLKNIARKRINTSSYTIIKYSNYIEKSNNI